MTDVILALNAGSSSIKYAVFDAARRPLDRTPLWQGRVEGITSTAPVYRESGGTDAEPLDLSGGEPYHLALMHIRERVLARIAPEAVRAISHRVVHGGAKYFAPTRVDAAVLADLRGYVPLAPLHQPFALEAIAALLELRPDLPQVACFDTAFHHTLPVVEQMLPLPRALWERGVRRYGFHGLSYEYQSLALAERYGDAARGRTIVAHLGSGASLCALHESRSVATTMGFSALDGLMMGTRCGALDPGALIYLMQTDGLDPERLSALLYHESGLLGVSRRSADPRVLLEHPDDACANEALDLYVRRIVREIGALAAVLGGLDLLAFTAGIGEHNATIRARVCAALGHLGVTLDEAANRRHEPRISDPRGAVIVAVEPTNEEWIAATHAATLLGC